MRITAYRGETWGRRLNGSHAAHLLVAQEAERRRVSREIHDDLAQKVALLEFEIEAMKRRFTSQPEFLPELETLRGYAAMLAEDVHRICYRLHPVVLDNLGLVRGIEFLCDEQSRISGVKTEFSHGVIPEKLPANVSLCLYRVVQEGLQNASRHARAKEAKVGLHKIGRGIRAVVSDSGCGFDAKEASSKSGLGLAFINERVKLLNGRCTIHSAPGKGTRINVYVPIPSSGEALPFWNHASGHRG